MTLPCTKRGKPNLVENELLTRVRHIVPETSRTGEEISRRWVIAIDTGVVKANCPSKLKEYGQDCTETNGMVKKKGQSIKTELVYQFLLEEKLTFQRVISSVIEEHGIPKQLVLSLDQTPLPNVSTEKYAF